MKTLRFYKIVITVLFVMNLTTLYFLWDSSRRPPHHKRKDLVEMLNLTGPAKTKVTKLQTEHFRVKDSLVDRGRDLHEYLFRSFNDPTKDSIEIKKIINDIVENQRETEQMTFDYFKKVNSLCTQEQQEELQGLIHDVIRKEGGPPPPPRR